MKFLIAILLFFSILTAHGQWQNVGNAERIKAYDTEIKDFVISEDNQFIYTLDTSGTIKKWDYETGDSLSSFRVIPDSTCKRTDSWIFLSADGKTFCTAYYAADHNRNASYKILIFNIDNHQFLDSILLIRNYDCAVTDFNYGSTLNTVGNQI